MLALLGYRLAVRVKRRIARVWAGAGAGAGWGLWAGVQLEGACGRGLMNRAASVCTCETLCERSSGMSFICVVIALCRLGWRYRVGCG